MDKVSKLITQASMLHLNGHVLAAVDVETTGLNPDEDEVIEVCVLPLDNNLEPHRQYKAFNTMIKPTKRPLDPNRNPQNGLSAREILTYGMEKYRAADLLEEWFNGLKLPPKKQIIPLAHNWVFDREFLIDWLGRLNFEYIFNGHYRDTMVLGAFHNDRKYDKAEPYDFAKISLAAMCERTSIENKMAHRALYDCLATAQLYKKLVEDYSF